MADYATDAAPGMIKREAGMAALTTTGYVGTTWDQRAPVTTRATCVINLENPKVSANDESYTFTILGYNAADRSDATILGQAIAGASTAGLEKVRAAAGQQLAIGFATEKGGVTYRRVDLHLAVAGTAPSVAFNARITKGN